MAIEPTLPDTASPAWQSALTQHLGLVVSALAFGLVSIRVLGVANFDVVTALAIVQAGGAVNVAIGSVLASVSMIALVVIGVVGNSLATQLADRFEFTNLVLLKLSVCIFVSLFAFWWIAAVATTVFLALGLITWLLRVRRKRRLSKLEAINVALNELDSEDERLRVEFADVEEKRSLVTATLDRIKREGRKMSSEESEQVSSDYQEYKQAYERVLPKIEQHIKSSENVKLKYLWITSKRAWIGSKFSSFKAKFQSGTDDSQRQAGEAQRAERESTQVEAGDQVQPAGVQLVDDQEQRTESDLEQVGVALQEQTADVQQHQLEVQQSRPATWPSIVFWVLAVVPQVILASTLSWLPVEVITVKKEPSFAAYVLSQSDREVVFLREDRGTVERVPTGDLMDRQICRSVKGLWAKSTIGLMTQTPSYPGCPPGTDGW
ncbi:hypothetical protein ACWZJV_09030 [Nocardioides sp. WG-D5]